MSIRYLAPQPSEIDARLYMHALCGHLQTIYLNRRGIRCLLDADTIDKLPETACRMLGLMVGGLLIDAGNCSQTETTRAPITVTLHRRGATCLCTISHVCLAESRARVQPGLRRLLRLASELSAACMVRWVIERGMLAIIFDIDLVERCFPAAIRRYRWST
jgi:hypothetical protein